jgi:eukaryotic-like serine/threonine-protein kinase
LRLDRYELLCQIAEGGMATVWIARQTGKLGFEKLVAIKTILAKFAGDQGFQRMFIDEARIASRIEHPNVAQILDVGEQQGVTYLVMEYVDGDALSRVHRALERKGALISQGVLLRVMADVCGGLHVAHELRDEQEALLGIVHRDVSPQNVLVSTRGNAKLIDFGIAKASALVEGEISNVGQLKGKARYMAPEQALGRPLDRRADLWAIGAVLYRLLTGNAPYEAETDAETLLLLKCEAPLAPLPATMHPAVAAVVRRALLHKADDRFASAAEMQQAIEDAMVEANLATSTVTVAAFLEEHLADRARKRQETIALGVKAAAERDKYAALMRVKMPAEPTSRTSLSGLEGAGREADAASKRGGSDASGAPIEVSTGRQTPGRIAVAVAFAAVVLAVLGVVAMRRTPAPAATQTAAPSGAPEIGAPSATPADTASAGVVAASAATASAPEIDINSLPVQVLRPPPPPPPRPASPAAAPKPNRKRVDDGF